MRYTSQDKVFPRLRRDIAIAGCGLIVGATAITGTAMAATTSGPSAVVTHFNDGFATAKQDDCEQGFKPACEWLAETHTAPSWVHVQPAPKWVARSMCGHWKTGGVVPGVEVWAVNAKGVQSTDGVGYCKNGKVSSP
jgi:hypothetical protein